jgi:hypothetical protein
MDGGKRLSPSEHKTLLPIETSIYPQAVAV